MQIFKRCRFTPSKRKDMEEKAPSYDFTKFNSLIDRFNELIGAIATELTAKPAVNDASKS